jgi:hypothetical protein
MESNDRISTRKAAIGFFLELLLYGGFITVYFLVVLQFLSDPLTDLYQTDLLRFAVISLGLIVAQAVLLDVVVTFLLDLIGLGRIR